MNSYTNWNISTSEYYGDKELRAAFDNLRQMVCVARRPMAVRIANELNARAAAGCHSEEMALKMAEQRDRLNFKRDFEAYKAANS